MPVQRRSPLFADSFQSFRKMTFDQAIQGYGFPFGYQPSEPSFGLHSPDEIDAISRSMGRFGRPSAESAAETASQHRPINDIVHSWARNHREIMVGSDHARIARDLLDLGDEIVKGRPNDTKIYRGASLSPAKQVELRPDSPLSYTADHHAAYSFAKGGGGRGSIFHAQAGSLRGIYVPDYVDRQRTVGVSSRPESEWLIDPSSVGEHDD